MKPSIPDFYRVQVVIILVTLVTFFSNTSAQNFEQKFKRYQARTSNYRILGAGFGYGTSSYKFKSNVSALKGLKVYGEGWNTEFIIGNKEYKIRGGFGKYHFDKSRKEAINQMLFTAKLNISPKVIGMTKYVRLYLVTGVDYNIYEFKGMAIPQPQKIISSPAPDPVCNCPAPSEREAFMLGDGPTFLNPVEVPESEGEPTEVKKDEEPVAQVKKAQIDTGLGMEINVLKKGYFLRLFAEAYYGFPFKEDTYNLGLSKTQITPQLMINFGVGIGLGR